MGVDGWILGVRVGLLDTGLLVGTDVGVSDKEYDGAAVGGITG